MEPRPSQVVLILSAFAEALQAHCPHFVRANQDDLGDRREVERAARDALNHGLSVCIDRQNFDARQRATWIDIAGEFPGTVVHVIVFDTPYEICRERLVRRTGHPTVHTVEKALELLDRFTSMYRPPEPREGYQRLIYLRPSDHDSPVYTGPEVEDILRRLRDAPPVEPPQTLCTVGKIQGAASVAMTLRANGAKGASTRLGTLRTAYIGQKQDVASVVLTTFGNMNVLCVHRIDV
ncbi:hypothetical protein GGG16DRAFT_42890 [Schizophyllum commune]